MTTSPKYQIIREIYAHDVNPLYEVSYQGRRYVLKKYREVIHPLRGVYPEILDELMVFANFDHPNILKTKKIWYARGQFYFLMENLDGTLADLIKEQPSPTEIRSYLKQMLQGLLAMHEKGLFHNDLKPANIMYSQNKKSKTKTLKLIDFGLTSSIHYPYYRYREAQATYNYTPPEYMEYRDIGRISLNSDMFSLGILFYYLIQPDEYAERDMNTLFHPDIIQSTKVKKIIGVQGLDLLQKMLTFDPEERISSRDALAHPYFQSKKTKSPRKKKGGGRSSISILTKEEYQHPTNQTQFLPVITQNNLKTKAVFSQPSLTTVTKKIPAPNLWHHLKAHAEDYRPLTLNYAICLFYRYLQKKEKFSSSKANYYNLGLTCLLLSMKLCEHNTKPNFKKFKEAQKLKQLEIDLLQTLDYELPLPMLLTIDVPLYQEFLTFVYDEHSSKVSNKNLNTLWASLATLSTLSHFSPKLMSQPKEDLISLIFSFVFSDQKIKSSATHQASELSLLVAEYL